MTLSFEDALTAIQDFKAMTLKLSPPVPEAVRTVNGVLLYLLTLKHLETEQDRTQHEPLGSEMIKEDRLWEWRN